MTTAGGAADFDGPCTRASRQNDECKILVANVGYPTDRIQPTASKSVVVMRWRRVVYEGRGRVYSPDELMLFRRVFEKALASLPGAMRTDECRLRIAQNLLACAATGERDPVELRIAALADIRAAAA